MSATGIGMLEVRAGGAPVQRWAIQEGGGIVADLAGHDFMFVLEKAPLPSEFDIRRMDSLQLAQALVSKLKDEREQDAI